MEGLCNFKIYLYSFVNECVWLRMNLLLKDGVINDMIEIVEFAVATTDIMVTRWCWQRRTIKPEITNPIGMGDYNGFTVWIQFLKYILRDLAICFSTEMKKERFKHIIEVNSF